MQMSVAYVSHSDCGVHDTGWGHVEHVGRLRAVSRALRDDPELFMSVQHVEGRHATLEECALAHDPDYLARLQQLAAEGGGHVDPETVMSAGSWDAALASAGSVLHAVDNVLGEEVRRAFCAVRPPGHHALPAAGMGFCLLGNVGIAAHHARVNHRLDRVLIVDWDVHHGNGTQAMVEHDPGIRMVSMHQWPLYPGTGAAEDRGARENVWNIPRPAGLEPLEYVRALEEGIESATLDWTPDLVLVSAGFDCLAGDPLGGFTLRMEDVATLTRMVTDRADTWCRGRVVSALEGGYVPSTLGEACAVHIRALNDD
jgi:acetoin utilization deacetylase AcuC-like enzyme